MDHTFETPNPPELAIEIGSGRVEITAGETNGRTLVTVTGKGSEETTVEQHGNTIAVTGPRSRHGFSFSLGSSQLHVRISAPRGSSLSTKLGSADLVAAGVLGTCAPAPETTGSRTSAPSTSPPAPETWTSVRSAATRRSAAAPATSGSARSGATCSP